MIHIAVLVAEDLDLDVTRAQDHLFKITLAVAKGSLGLAPPLEHLVLQLIRPLNGAHATPAAAP